MKTEALEKAAQMAPAIERALVMGDLAGMTSEQRVMFYKAVCESVGLNPLTRPFEYITLNGKLTLYARKDATDQLRQLHKISVEIMSREMVDDCYVVKARALAADGRADESIGAVTLGQLKGEMKANAIMKAETKAKRRVTLSICGLGMLDESEADPRPRRGPWKLQDEIVPADSALSLPEPETLTMEEGLSKAASLEELAQWAAVVKDLPQSERERLRPIYVQRKMELESAAGHGDQTGTTRPGTPSQAAVQESAAPRNGQGGEHSAQKGKNPPDAADLISQDEYTLLLDSLAIAIKGGATLTQADLAAFVRDIAQKRGYKAVTMSKLRRPELPEVLAWIEKAKERQAQ